MVVSFTIILSLFECDMQLPSENVFHHVTVASHHYIPLGFQGELSLSKKLTYLSRFYKTTVDNLLPLPEDKAQLKDNSAEDQGKGNWEGNTHTTLRGKVAHKIIETYTHAKVCHVSTPLQNTWPGLPALGVCS